MSGRVNQGAVKLPLPAPPPDEVPDFTPEQVRWLSGQLSRASAEAERLGIPAHQDMAMWLRYRLWAHGLEVVA